MRPKKWVKVWFAFFSVIPLVAMVNYIVDPFDVLQSNIMKYHFQLNERFLKIAFLEKNHSKFDSYMFGSSRIATTKPSVIEKYLPGTRFYNLTFADANLYDHLLHLQYFVDQNYEIKNVYMQIDIADMFSYGQNRSDYMRRFHPHVVGEQLPRFYLEYLFGFFPMNVAGKIEQNLKKKSGYAYFLESGIWKEPEKESRISSDCQAYVEHESTFHSHSQRQKRPSTIEKSLDALRAIRKLCDLKGATLYLFTTPHNRNMMDSFDVSEYLTLLKRLADVQNYYDFSGYNSVTLDNCNYYESSHYRPHVGTLIAARIFQDTSVPIPHDFGFLVTKENIDSHIEDLKKQIENYDLVRMEQ